MQTKIGHREFNLRDSKVHSPFVPLEIYQNNGIVAEITNIEDKTFSSASKVPVMSISPVGAELDLTKISNNLNIKTGDQANVKICFNDIQTSFLGIFITETTNEFGRVIVGMRWCEPKEGTAPDQDRRSSTRWLCAESFVPTGIAPNPVRFNDFIYFKVLDFSKEGMQINTSFRNKLLIPGMVLQSVISLPLVGEAEVSFKVQNVRIKEENGKDILTLGVRFLQPSDNFFESVAQYLLQFGRGVSPSSLKEFGLAPKSINSAIEYSFVKDADTYLEILKLRRKTYTATFSIEDKSEDLRWADFYDSKSRIIVAKHQGKCVGTVRLTFHEPSELSEYHEYVKFPDEFPLISEMLVSGRLCTDPEYRGNDLFDGIIKQMVLTGLQSKRKYILGSCKDDLIFLYERVGLKPTGIRYKRTSPEAVDLEVLCMDVSSTIVGRGISFLWWRRLYKDLYHYISDFKDFEITPLDRLRLGVFIVIDKVLSFFRI